MLHYENNQYNICKFIAHYTTYGQRTFKYTNDKQWWTEFANRWWHHRDLQFTPVTPTQAQLDRLAEINNAGISGPQKSGSCMYVESGLLPRDEQGNIRPPFDRFTERPDLENSMLQAEYELPIEELMDKKAQERRYKNADRLMVYASSTDQRWKAEADAFAKWRDDMFAYCFQVLSDVAAGTRVAPTVRELLSELPEMVWPEKHGEYATFGH